MYLLALFDWFKIDFLQNEKCLSVCIRYKIEEEQTDQYVRELTKLTCLYRNDVRLRMHV